MDKLKRYKELLKKREIAREKLDSAKMRLGHPHLDFMSAHDLAESEFGVFSAHLEEIEKEISELEKALKIK
jgi:hypothetical protein